MTTESDLERKVKSHIDFWDRTPGTGPLITRTAYVAPVDAQFPLPGGKPASEGTELTVDQVDVATVAPYEKPRVIASRNLDTILQRDADPGMGEEADGLMVVTPHLRMPWIEAMMGCPILVEEGWLRAEAFLQHPWDLDALRVSDENVWLQKLLELTRELVDLWERPYFVAHTPLGGPVDVLTAMLGNIDTIYLLADHPDDCEHLLELCADAFIRSVTAQLELLPKVQDGYCSPLGVWAPGTVVRAQCDASGVVGPRMYQSHFLALDLQICEAFEYSIMHLHSGLLHSIDSYLGSGPPNAIQIEIDPEGFGPPLLSLTDIFVTILDRKPLMIEGRMTKDELEQLVNTLPGDGLFINAAIIEAG